MTWIEFWRQAHLGRKYERIKTCNGMSIRFGWGDLIYG